MTITATNAGWNWVKDKKFKLALQDLNKAIEMKPSNADYVVSRAETHMALNETKLALEDLQARRRS